MSPIRVDNDSASIARLRKASTEEEFRTSLRALLMRPLMRASDDDFPAVRRQADALRAWLARETGWALHVDSGGARLLKRPGDLFSAVRGLEGYDRRRYALFCLACAVLERSDPQITLRLLGEKLLELAADPDLASAGFQFTLGTAQERRELVFVCRTLLDLGILICVAGGEEGYVMRAGETADALYDVERRLLAGVMAAARGPSTWRREEAPETIEDRLLSLAGELALDSDEARRTAVRHRLARRLLDDPVVYAASLTAEEQAYFANQRGAMADRLCQATGLMPELRAEGAALVDATGTLSDDLMPAEGTDAHVTLLVAEMLAGAVRGQSAPEARAGVTMIALVGYLMDAQTRFGRYWRKSSQTPDDAPNLAEIAVRQLQRLHLAARDGELIRGLPAIARFAVAEAEVVDKPDAVSATRDPGRHVGARPSVPRQQELEPG